MFDTLKLDPTTWDLTLDGSGNIAVQRESYAIAQDVGSAIQAIQGECWFDTTQGLPYFTSILGQSVNTPLFVAYYNQAAMTVPNVTRATTAFNGVSSARKLTGTVQVIDTYGETLNASF
jgi:hypothetical protein